jgi:ribonuclease HI
VISVYCDGSSSSRGGKPGGWAYVIVRDSGSTIEKVLVANYGGEAVATNNTMELTAALEGIRSAQALIELGKIQKNEVVELVSDSQYALNMANGGWTPSRDSEGNVKNGDLISALQAVAKTVLTPDPWDKDRPRTRWVPGHTGDTWNERCDKLAKQGKEEAKAKLAVMTPGRCGCGSEKYASDHGPHAHGGWEP